MKRILVIEDDPEQYELIGDFFKMEGDVCKCARTGDEGLQMLEKEDFDLVLLDIMLPGRDGFEILREIRSRQNIPVLIVTAKTAEIDRIVGLEIGADDYICKPFSPRELAARIRAVLRRADDDNGRGDHGGDGNSDKIIVVEAGLDGILQVDDLKIDLHSRSARIGERDILLSNTEFRILELLLRNAGTLVSTEIISASVLRRDHKVSDRSISVHMSNLRRKLGPYPSGSERIATVRGEGFVYIYAKQPPAEE